MIELPNRQKVKDSIVAMANENQKTVLAMIPSGSKVSLAMDCWTSQTCKAFMAITCYFFTSDWQYKEALLGFEPLVGKHSGTNLANVALRVLEQHELQLRVLAVATDGASNNTTMMVQFNDQIRETLDTSPALRSQAFDADIMRLTDSSTHIPCLAHVIQLAVRALLDSVRVTAKNQQVDNHWDDEVDRRLMATYDGLPSTLEKVSPLKSPTLMDSN